MTRIGVIGAGHWGPNLIRNFHNHQTSEVAWIIDRDAGRQALVRSRYPEVRVGADADPALTDPAVDAVVIATPAATTTQPTARVLLSREVETRSVANDAVYSPFATAAVRSVPSGCAQAMPSGSALR